MIPNFKSVEEMCEDFDLPTSCVEEIAEYAKLQFDGGDYPLVGQLLKHYRNMQANEMLTSKHISCLWGSLACALLNHEGEEAAELLFKLDQLLEDSKAPKRE